MEQEMTGKTSIEPLGSFAIKVSGDHTFGTDAVLLADFAGRSSAEVAVDLGTGCGIIPLLLIKNEAAKSVTGVEIQSNAAALAAENAELNGIADRFKVKNADLKYIKDEFAAGTADLVTCNPPYKAEGTGSKNLTEAQKIARHEVMCTLPDVVAAAARLLKFGGRLCICHRPERLCDIFCTMREKKIEPKVLREVIQRDGCEPWLVLVEGRSGGKPGLKIMPPLIVERDGCLSDEMMDIYGDYKQGRSRKA